MPAPAGRFESVELEDTDKLSPGFESPDCWLSILCLRAGDIAGESPKRFPRLGVTGGLLSMIDKSDGSKGNSVKMAPDDVDWFDDIVMGTVVIDTGIISFSILLDARTMKELVVSIS